MKFCDKLAQLRKANNLSQEQLADRLNVSRQSVSKWESGDTYPDMAKMIQMMMEQLKGLIIISDTLMVLRTNYTRLRRYKEWIY